jgi:glycosyltransferase involved in cell wall biosynthesis
MEGLASNLGKSLDEHIGYAAQSLSNRGRLGMRIASIVFTPLAQDARVRRTATALKEAGHDVLVVARAPFPADSDYRRFELPALPAPAVQRFGLVATQAPATVLPGLAPALYWLPPLRRAALRALLEFKPDIVICNDWNTLPVGAAVNRRTGAKLIYDAHELATREHVQNWKWRLVSQRAVREIEGRNMPFVDLVTTVSEGIAQSLCNLYDLTQKPLVIRNLPSYQNIAFRKIELPLTVLFHGLIRQERGLEELIDSMPAWRFEGRVIIRGYGQPGYLDALKARARERGVADKVIFAPRVSPEELISEAASADIGYLALPGTTEHYEYALPNKLFEYVMAGLPVMATARVEMAAMLSSTGCGFITELDALSIAKVLNEIKLDELNTMRKAALAAARDLSWEKEKSRLAAAIASFDLRLKASA